ncbi:AAA family ATPase [Hymenobacter actinosclerus]|uniref:5-methylcytosine-specific restriction enzyme B n=1 Tax=Hymenobacter actinosclerus TaxID=82805 RepID=A0A1H9Z0S6_9BACT|nr:AAA family ATPase [Hymenobacter actinosclerus]SES74571.1 5-methylcytosine-specific restriction enzyme B [Hymenobacter actinosclerus]
MPDSATPFAPTQLTRDHILRALRLIERQGQPLPPSTVYDLVYKGRRYPPRPVLQLAFQLASGQPAATLPLRAGEPTNQALEALDFTIATKRPTLENSPLLDGDVTAQQQLEDLYTGSPREATAAKKTRAKPTAEAVAASETDEALTAAEPTAAYERPAPTPYTLEMARAELFLSDEELTAARAALARRRNLLLQGPPGTGKTFLARRLAWLALGTTDAARIELVQFHPSYSYEDFVQGFRPDSQGGFRLRDGLLVEFCRRASLEPERPYFLLIDELNRGNVARIFGELLLLLEADKRGPAHAVRLPYAPAGSPPFFVPENVFVIGTMNLADRSLAPLDYALRRRFAFVSLRPEFGEPLRALLAAQGVPADLISLLTTRLTALNQTIADDPELGPDFCVGHSYFCQPPTNPAEVPEWLRLILEQEIGPLLDDYWLDQPAKAAQQKKKLLAGL